MCRPATCRQCGKTTWAGCGQRRPGHERRAPRPAVHLHPGGARLLQPVAVAGHHRPVTTLGPGRPQPHGSMPRDPSRGIVAPWPARPVRPARVRVAQGCVSALRARRPGSARPSSGTRSARDGTARRRTAAAPSTARDGSPASATPRNRGSRRAADGRRHRRTLRGTSCGGRRRTPRRPGATTARPDRQSGHGSHQANRTVPKAARPAALSAARSTACCSQRWSSLTQPPSPARRVCAGDDVRADGSLPGSNAPARPPACR